MFLRVIYYHNEPEDLLLQKKGQHPENIFDEVFDFNSASINYNQPQIFFSHYDTDISFLHMEQCSAFYSAILDGIRQGKQFLELDARQMQLA